jgi:hypothetical protein
VKPARALRTVLVLAALYLASTGQVGGCAPDRNGSRKEPDAQAMSQYGLRRYGNYGPEVALRVHISPAPARLGQALRYRAYTIAGPNQKLRFETPKSEGAFSWSNVRAGRSKQSTWDQWRYGKTYGDSVWFEARLQVFETGVISVPGPGVRIDPGPASGKPTLTRLPTVQLLVLATVTAADSNQSLRGLHGPLGAPWWERLPLAWIAGGLAGLAVAALVVSRLRRRKRRPLPRPSAPTAVPGRPRLDPVAEALRAMAALRAAGLPAQQRFGEHALELTAILRRFLEATVTTPRPGDTSGELLERLRASRMPNDDLERLEGLLGLWDRVKFARWPLTEAEARRCEEAVEAYVRRVAQARLEAQAAAARAAAARAAAAQGRKSAAGVA